MKHVMVDLETIGTTPNSVMLSIGAVSFELGASCDMDGCLHTRVDVGSSLLAGMDISTDTVQWWRQQNQAATQAAWGLESRRELRDALHEFSEFFKLAKAEFIWGNGADIDIALLRRAYSLFDMATPWHYRNTRCYRTINSLFGGTEDFVQPTVAHNALEDAIAQAKTLQNIFNRGHWVRESTA